MKTLSEIQANTEWVKFYETFNRLGLLEHFDEETLKNELLSAPCGMTEDTGTAYKGALLIHINMVAALAQRTAKMISGTFEINEDSLLKVCYLMHLSKRYMFKENGNAYGRVFDFNNDVMEGVLYGGERSALEALNRGITFSPIEYEAIKCLDGESTNSQKAMQSILTTIVRQANELAYAIERERYNKIKN